MKTIALLGAFISLQAHGPRPVGSQTTSPKRVEISKNVILEVDGDKRRVLINAYVCFRQGLLEQLLTRKGTKEHEAILAADIDARSVHSALMLAGAEPGKPVQFRPKFQPPTGPVIKVFVEYKDKDEKTHRLPAQQWIRTLKTKKDLPFDWVFAGSELFKDPNDAKRPPYYLANDGDVICIANFHTAMLDLPIESSAQNDDLVFEANTERIPPLRTPVTLILEPVMKK